MQGACDNCVVRDRALCSSLDDESLGHLSRIGRRRQLAAGETLQFEGDQNLICANVLSGVLKLSSVTSGGDAQTVGLLYPSDFVGRPFADTADHDIVALTDAEVCTFARTPFERFIGDHPALERQLLKRTLAELERSREWLLFLGRKSAHARVASLLRDIERRLAHNGCSSDFGIGQRIELPMTRAEMADVLGLTIETVSREFGKFRDAAIIATEGRRGLRILDPEALMAAIDGD